MPLTCLIAAHDPWFIQLIRIYSTECGLRAAEAFVSQDILPVIHQEQPSVILLQANLPGHVHGPELACSIRNDPVAQNIPIVIFYSQALSVTPELAEIAAARIQEPVSFKTFQEALEKVGIPIQGKMGPALANPDDKDAPPAPNINKYPKRKTT